MFIMFLAMETHATLCQTGNEVIVSRQSIADLPRASVDLHEKKKTQRLSITQVHGCLPGCLDHGEVRGWTPGTP